MVLITGKGDVGSDRHFVCRDGDRSMDAATALMATPHGVPALFRGLLPGKATVIISAVLSADI